MRADDLRRELSNLAREEKVTVDAGAVIRRGQRRLIRRRVMIGAAALVIVTGTIGLVTRGHGDAHVVVQNPTPASTVSPASPTSLQATSTTTSAPTTTTSPATTTSTTPAGIALRSVQWSSVLYPMTSHCGTVFNPAISVRQVAYPNPTPGVQLAAVLVRCNVGAGTPPVALYLYDRATSTRSPHLVETLVTDTDEWQANTFAVNGAMIDLPVAGFSSNAIPNCCPDVRTTLAWRWTGSTYQLLSSIPQHIKVAAFGHP
jgi:hypothetical protein